MGDFTKDEAQALRNIGPEPGSLYRHYKGDYYRVIENAIHEVTCSHLVIYQSVEKGFVWARDLSVWEETVMVEGQSVKRFTQVVQ